METKREEGEGTSSSVSAASGTSSNISHVSHRSSSSSILSCPDEPRLSLTELARHSMSEPTVTLCTLCADTFQWIGHAYDNVVAEDVDGAIVLHRPRALSRAERGRTITKARPEQPAVFPANIVSLKAFKADKARMQWLTDYERHDEFKQRRNVELNNMRNRPKRNRAPVDMDASMARYRERLESISKAEFRKLQGVWISVYKFKGRVTGPAGLPKTADLRWIHVLYEFLGRYGVKPIGIVSACGKWVDKTKYFDVVVPATQRRVTVARDLPIQKVKGNTLCFLQSDQVLDMSVHKKEGKAAKKPGRGGREKSSKLRATPSSASASDEKPKSKEAEGDSGSEGESGSGSDGYLTEDELEGAGI